MFITGILYGFGFVVGVSIGGVIISFLIKQKQDIHNKYIGNYNHLTLDALKRRNEIGEKQCEIFERIAISLEKQKE